MIYTREQEVEGEVYVWAIPKYNPQPGEMPFNFELSTLVKHWRDDAVRVSEHVISVVMPGKVNLVEAALETIEKAEEHARRELAERLRDLGRQKQQLLQLTHFNSEAVEVVSDQ